MSIVAAITSLGSGTIIAGRRSAYVNDSKLTSGSVINVTLHKEPSMAAGAGPVKAIVYTTGSPNNGHSLQVVLQGVAEKNVNFTYAIISGSNPDLEA